MTGANRPTAEETPTPRPRRGLSIGGAVVAAGLGAAAMLGAVTLIDMSDTTTELAGSEVPDTTAATPVAALQGEPASTVWIQFTDDNEVERTAAVVIDDAGHLAAVHPALSAATDIEALTDDDSVMPLVVLTVDETTGVAVLAAERSDDLEPTVGAPAAVGTSVRLGTPATPSIATGDVQAANSTIAIDGQVERGLFSIGAAADEFVNVALDTTGSRVVGLLCPSDPHPDDQVHYVVPFEILERVVNDYLRHGATAPASLGVTTETPPIPNTDESGLVITEVHAETELRVGDELVTVDGQPVRHVDDLLGELLHHSPGDTLRVSVERGHQLLDLAITLPTDR